MDSVRRFDIITAVLVIFILSLTIYLSKYFIFPVLLSIVLVFLLKPVYNLFFRLTKNKIVSSALTIMLLVFIMLLILGGLTQVLLQEISNIQTSGFQVTSAQNTSEEFYRWFKTNFSGLVLDMFLGLLGIAGELVSGFSGAIKSSLIFIISNLPLYFAQSIVILFFIFFLLFDGGNFVQKAIKLVPRERRDLMVHFLDELYYIYNNLFSSFVLTALITGVLAFFSFVFLNVPYPFFLGVIVVLFTLIPFVGAPWVFIPLACFYLLLGNYSLAIALVTCGILLFLIPQYLIMPQLAQKRGKIHPLVTVLAFVAPLFILGLPGIVIGPTLYGFLLAAYRTVDYYNAVEEGQEPIQS
ncbi:MAG: AI-2E family transporter [Methanotrichaceae archaeon]|nr:AI-2E family transporter [Methanotrichaceae archaeon]